MFTAGGSGPVHPVDVRLTVLGVETVLRYHPASGEAGAWSSDWEGIAKCLTRHSEGLLLGSPWLEVGELHIPVLPRSSTLPLPTYCNSIRTQHCHSHHPPPGHLLQGPNKDQVSPGIRPTDHRDISYQALLFQPMSQAQLQLKSQRRPRRLAPPTCRQWTTALSMAVLSSRDLFSNCQVPS